jgi:hypothetical protein
MRKEILVSLLVFSILAGTSPIFAINHQNTKALNETQLAKLNETQTQINALVKKINGLLVTYKNTKNKGLLLSLIHFKKQAKMLNAEIKWFKKHPRGNFDKKIKMFINREAQLGKKVNTTAKILNKTQNKTTIHKNLTLNKTNCTHNQTR